MKRPKESAITREAGRAAKTSAPSTDSIASAKSAGLRYVSLTGPGIRRKSTGQSMVYFGTNGETIKDADILARIKSLAIPPAWRDVWICPIAHGHLQATGIDAKGRKQYRYHPRWRAVRDETKYDRMVFGRALPGIRARVEHDLARSGLPREKILATIIRLLETTLIRVGNEEYARQNASFGLTTMQDRHVDISGATLTFEFRGKSGISHSIDLTDRRLAKIVKRSQDLPGYELFQYLDEQGTRTRRLRRCECLSQRDLWGGIYRQRLSHMGRNSLSRPRSAGVSNIRLQAQAKRNVVQAIEAVAKRLGNTKAVCRKCYVHPRVIDLYMDGSLLQTLKRRVKKELSQSLHGLPPEEAAVLALLQQRLGREERGRRAGGDNGRSAVPLSRLLRQSIKKKQTVAAR